MFSVLPNSLQEVEPLSVDIDILDGLKAKRCRSKNPLRTSVTSDPLSKKAYVVTIPGVWTFTGTAPNRT